MNIIIPMAGMGKRMRPHTLTVPKPLLPVAGKPIVHRLVEDIAKVCREKIDTIGFVIGDFGPEVEKELIAIAGSVGAKGEIFYQNEALGTAHAVYCAEPLLQDRVIVAFADTLFKAEFQLDFEKDGIIWVKEVEDPSAFGVVKMNDAGEIIDFVEKPKEPVSKLAIIGIYYFKKGEDLKRELQKLIDDRLMDGGEYQLTRALRMMRQEGLAFVPGEVTDWLDCGNKDATVATNKRYLEYLQGRELVSRTAALENSKIIEPCFIGEGVELYNTVVGPYVSIGDKSVIKDSRISNSIVQSNVKLTGVVLENSMLGNFVTIEKDPLDLSLSDYSSIFQ